MIKGMVRRTVEITACLILDENGVVWLDKTRNESSQAEDKNCQRTLLTLSFISQ